MSRTRKYKRYSPEFKREALKRASEDGTTDKQVCEDLGISSRQLRRWRRTSTFTSVILKPPGNVAPMRTLMVC
jgi:transposase-like protein